MGGLGNQLFEYATGRSISLRTGLPLKLDLSFFEEEKFKGVFRLDKYNVECDIASIDETNALKGYVLQTTTKNKLIRKIFTNRLMQKNTYFIESTSIDYDLRILKLNQPAYIEGWLSKFIYFEEYTDVLRKELTLNDTSPLNQNLIEQVTLNNSVSIHVRRGEYLVNPYFHNLSINYYLRAMEELNLRFENLSYYVFSDDIAWAKENLATIKNIQFIEENSLVKNYYNTEKDYLDLHLMSLCKHNIIANSTFSWWSAWLNKNSTKIVIAPKMWYDNTEAQQNYEISKSFIPKTWIKI